MHVTAAGVKCGYAWVTKLRLNLVLHASDWLRNQCGSSFLNQLLREWSNCWFLSTLNRNPLILLIIKKNINTTVSFIHFNLLHLFWISPIYFPTGSSVCLSVFHWLVFLCLHKPRNQSEQRKSESSYLATEQDTFPLQWILFLCNSERFDMVMFSYEAKILVSLNGMSLYFSCKYLTRNLGTILNIMWALHLVNATWQVLSLKMM